MTHPNAVKCPWCGAQPSEVCRTPPGPQKRKRPSPGKPLTLTAAHPSRIEAAMRLDGATDAEITRRVAGQLAAATDKYREQPGCAAVPVGPDKATPSHQPPPERPSAATTAAKTDPSGAGPAARPTGRKRGRA